MARRGWRLRREPHLMFWKLCGSGTGEGFTPQPNWGVWAILATWPDEATARAGTAQSPVWRRWRAHADRKPATVFLSPLVARGSWAGVNPFVPEPHPADPEGPLAALTRASVKPGRALRFWRRVPDISAVIGQDPNVLFKIGIGEVPLLHQVTFSIWPDAASMADFARGDGPHGRAITRRARRGLVHRGALRPLPRAGRRGALERRGTAGPQRPCGCPPTRSPPQGEASDPAAAWQLRAVSADTARAMVTPASTPANEATMTKTHDPAPALPLLGHRRPGGHEDRHDPDRHRPRHRRRAGLRRPGHRQIHRRPRAGRPAAADRGGGGLPGQRARAAICARTGRKVATDRIVTKPTPVVDLPLGVTEDRVVGALDIERALTRGEKAFEPGLLARANRGYLYIDEVNLLEDHIVDLLLDVAQSGENVVEREGLSIRHPARFVLVGSGNPEEGELRPQLLDRFGLSVEVTSPARHRDAGRGDPPPRCL